MKKKVIIVVVVIVVILVLIGILKSAKKGENLGISQKVKAHLVENGTIVVKLEETGEIEPIKVIEIKSKISGKIITFFVEEGDFIKKGDVVAEIEPDYNQAETMSRLKKNLELAQIRLKNAEEDFSENKEMLKEKFISQSKFDDISDEKKRAQLEYESAFNQYELIKEIETENNVSKIISSASGTVISRPVEEGEMVVSNVGSVSAGTIIAVLADLKRMVVKAHINEVDVSKIAKNQKVKIQVDAYPYEIFSGTITKIAPMAISHNNIKAFPVEVEIDKVDEKLKPGMTANITIIGEKKKDIVVVPIRCIFSNKDGQDIVYKVKSDTISENVVVKTGINNFQEVEIINGLEVGDSISFSEPNAKNNMKINFRF
ncbi:MAG: efflux RND transporter periplasmic adaptor subunit [Candidatus Cloacimonetes bacterium]|jgi:HlyD family secretion protein|nr:efflux RND transporter periplasmic adaptor subunit [Candidatus Cloacimonadota bacterium]MBT7469577.1 efflux RND transporter periplasmic adaptor subunit [Candidatus Cloacimonadota bacterium]